MMTAEEVKSTEDIKQIFNDYQSDIAFILGNGIHRYQNDENGLSWGKLLTDLWRTCHISDENDIPKGISNTEFYDILSMDATPYITQMYEVAAKENKSLKNYFADKIFNLSKEDLTDMVLKLSIPSTQNSENYNRIKSDKFLQNYVCNVMENWAHQTHHNKIVNEIKRMNAPILTTNYDKVLESAVDAYKQRNTKQGFTSFYPWSTFYSNNEVTDILNNFGIWHINGVLDYPNSIQLGLSQYMGSVSRAREMIQGRKSGTEIFSGKNQNDWDGKDTWLHILFNKSLFIFGLSLAENEVFLRWLLIQRAKYYRKFPERGHSAWYLIGKEESEAADFKGKSFFLRHFGVQIIVVENFKTIYEDIWL